MMVGDGPEKEKAEYLCQELGILDKVTLGTVMRLIKF
jgi:hypothetical protein